MKVSADLREDEEQRGWSDQQSGSSGHWDVSAAPAHPASATAINHPTTTQQTLSSRHTAPDQSTGESLRSEDLYRGRSWRGGCGLNIKLDGVGVAYTWQGIRIVRAHTHHSLSHHTHSLSLSHTHTQTHSPLSLSHTHTYTHTLSLSLTPTHTHTLSLSPLTHTHTHTHSLSLTHTHTHTLSTH